MAQGQLCPCYELRSHELTPPASVWRGHQLGPLSAASHFSDGCEPPCMSVFQVCDSDTVLDPACTIEMLKIMEDDPMVGGVGGDVQVNVVYL